MSEDDAKPTTYNLIEIRELLENLSRADQLRLVRFFQHRVNGLQLYSEDLLSEALCRILEGRRAWPKGLPPAVFIFGVMRSIRSEEIKRHSTDPLHQTVSNDSYDEGEQSENEIALKDKVTTSTPETELIAAQQVDFYINVFDDNPNAQMVVMARMDGYESPREIQELCSLSATEYASALRTIKRRLDKLGQRGD